jgi:hypothetical protein
VRLERDREREELFRRGRGSGGAQAERDRRRARAEASLERDAVDEVEPLPCWIRGQGVRAHGKVRPVGRQLS